MHFTALHRGTANYFLFVARILLAYPEEMGKINAQSEP